MTGQKPAQKPNDRDRRAERLAAALKQNLKRRKAQARGRTGAGDDAAPPADAQEHSDTHPKQGENC